MDDDVNTTQMMMKVMNDTISLPYHRLVLEVWRERVGRVEREEEEREREEKERRGGSRSCR